MMNLKGNTMMMFSILMTMTAIIRGEIIRDKGKICEFKIDSEIEKNGTIMTPNYPLPYSSKTLCIYELHGKKQERIRIVFLDINIYHPDGHSGKCENSDYLSIYVFAEGRMENIDTHCGNEKPRPIMSNGPWMRIEFHGRLALGGNRGFKALYSFRTDYAMQIGYQSLNYPCAFNFYSNETKKGYFHSPNFPGLYPRDTECHYFFYGLVNEKVSLHFSYFDIEGVSPCDSHTASDSVEFSNYHGEDRKYKRYCGELEVFDVESDSKFFRVTFRSNGRLDGTGFNATYDFINRMMFTTKKSGKLSESSTQRNGGSFRWSTPVPNGSYSLIILVLTDIVR